MQTQGSSKVKGDINGARLPWNYRIDLKIDKDFALHIGKKRDDKKPIYLNVYLQVLNLLNTKTTISVYRYTGVPDDDGYLSSAVGLDAVDTYAAQGQVDSFTEKYAL